MHSFYALLFAAFAAIVTSQTDCTAIQSNFQMIANTTSGLMYNQLGFPCSTGPCGSYFSIDQEQVASNFTFYSIDDTGILTVVGNNQPSNPEGVVAYNEKSGGGNFVLFATPAYVEAHPKFYSFVHCALLAESDGSCTVKCVEKRTDGKKKVSGDHVHTSDYNQWLIGKSKLQSIVIKAIASQTS